ncbi:hypothetical protein [Streptomyces rubradiris]|uniref:Uncharacterized protein n=1 Tax=Streptomyces rubradiris TaxID=285531 RepID=A0ABQ3RAF0_STRRR|nr:hypothetical protein [Streptomyces rubradiris]GHH26089.1 hypothetical protein GCM10018792_66130 [Streptomyces rubradiris]GHI52818.1 hypothetical protein Srubr_26640 [Streptomyces rubradiris]
MTTHASAAPTPYGAALHALSSLTGQPERFFLGQPGDSCRLRGANLEFLATLLLDLRDADALTARRRCLPRPQLLTVVEELERADEAAGPEQSDDEIERGWAA